MKRALDYERNAGLLLAGSRWKASSCATRRSRPHSRRRRRGIPVVRLEEGAEHESRAVRQVVAASRSGGLYGLTRAANSEPESADRQATGAHVGVSVMDTMPEAGRLDAFRIDGFDLWFNSSDHLPPHFHPEKAGRWEVRVQFMRDKTEMIETKWATGKGPSGPPFLTDRAEANRVELLIECEKNSRSR